MKFDADINARALPGGGVWRSAAPDELSAAGWAELGSAGVGTIVDLRNAPERGIAAGRPPGIRIVHAPLEDPDDPDYTALWDGNWGHPDFYAWGIGHWPALWRTAFEAIAEAPEGAVLIHCAGGRDRTGMLSALLLELAGAEREMILADYETGIRGTNEMLRRRGADPAHAMIPEERFGELLPRLRAALGSLLDQAPALLAREGLDRVAARAASRLTR